MKKSKLAVGIMTALLTAGTLAGCGNEVKYSDEGKIITYKSSNDEDTIKADELLKDYYEDSSKFQSLFDAINSIVVRNYFSKDPFIEEVVVDREGHKKQLGKPQMEQIKLEAEKDVESDKKTAQTNADNNDTSYSDEFEAILSSKGVKDEDELKEKYIEEHKKSTFEDNFYKYHMEDIKVGDPDVKYKSKDGSQKQLWKGYFEDMVPYHISHILVKLDDGSSTNYANGTISEANAKKLYSLVDELSDPENKDGFKTIANRYSDDDGSAAAYGDLGIMDTSTSFVNEFKLGVYAYENFFGIHQDEAANSNIKINSTISADLKEVSEEAFGAEIPEIDFDVFKELNDSAEIDKDVNGKAVIDDSANFYPRNIIYNKELNRHSIAFITTTDASKVIAKDGDKKNGFVNIEINGTSKNVLCVKTANGEWSPILCARAGTGDYQGIHFIVINRSKFTEDADVSLSEYYTTYFPEQDNYPVYPVGHPRAGEPKATYVNFLNNDTSNTKTKAGDLNSKFKAYDSERLNKYIFQRFFNEEGIKLADDQLQDILDKWIGTALDKKDEERAESWEKTWNEYIDTLRQQNDEREKLVSQACRIAYLNGNGLDKNKQKVELSDIIDDMAQAMVDAKEVSSLEAAKQKILTIRIGDKELPSAKGTYESGVNYCNAEGTLLVEGTDYNVGDAITGDVYVLDPAKSAYINEVVDLFKKEGALCNDGKEH